LVVVEQAAVCGTVFVVPGTEQQDSRGGDHLGERAKEHLAELSIGRLDHAIAPTAKNLPALVQIGDDLKPRSHGTSQKLLGVFWKV
jgi:hypothetical protein